MTKKLKNIMFANKDFAEYREADKIISYLRNPDGKTQINASLRKKLDRYTAIYNLKLEFKQNSYIVSSVMKIFQRNERQARADIAETEYIFGNVIKIDAAFEKAFMLEASRKNIELAYKTKDNNKITKALEFHNKLVGDDLPSDDLPDFSKFEQHTYNVVVPPHLVEMLKGLNDSGAVNFSTAIPSHVVQMAQDQAEDAEEVKDGD